jgi:sigma-B regulation protein RsbU (phosphoserine phosphatase)
MQLEPDDTLVLYSDGITEAENPERELFGFERLRDVLARWRGGSLESVKKAVFDSVTEFAQGAPQADDMTLLVVRYRAAD